MANSQEFQGVSPGMWREFCLEYQRPIIEQFGLSGYGCCENLTQKIDGVLSLKNLRIFVCSAWTSLEAVQEAVGQDYVIMWRQKASDVVFPDDVETIRRDLDALPLDEANVLPFRSQNPGISAIGTATSCLSERPASFSASGMPSRMAHRARRCLSFSASAASSSAASAASSSSRRMCSTPRLWASIAARMTASLVPASIGCRVNASLEAICV